MRGTSIRSCFLIIALLLVFMTMPVHGQGEQVRIGVLASRGAEDTLKTWQPTAEYLSKEIPHYSFVIVPLDIDEIVPAVGRKEVDFVITNPSSYVELEASYGATRIATMESMYGGHYYEVFSSVIFRRADRDDIGDLNDLKGKSFMAVQEKIFSWQMAWREFKDKGIDPYREFVELKFSGLPQDLVVYAVRDGKADAGAVRTGILESMASEGKINLSDFVVLNPQHHDFPLLHSTKFYPEWAFAKAKQTSDELAGKVAVALLSMPADSAAAKAASAVWTVPLDYQPVHELMKELRIGPYKDYGKIATIDFIKNYWYWIVIAVAAAGILPYTAGLKTVNKKLRQEISERKRAEEALKESEEKYHAMMNDASDAIALADNDGNLLDANKKMEELTGYTKNELLNMTFVQLQSHDELERNVAAFQETAQKGTPGYINDTLILRKDRKTVPVDLTGSVIEYAGKRMQQAIFRDITERKRAEEALHESEARYQNLANLSPVGIFRSDVHGNCVYVNERLCEITGQTPEQMYGLSWAKGLSPDDRERVLDEWKKARVENKPFNLECRFQRPDGTTTWLIVQAVSETGSAGEIVGYVGTLTDITQRKQAQDAQKESEEKHRTLIENIQDGIFMIQDARVQFANEAFARICGYRMEEVTGMDFRELVAPEDLEMVANNYQRRQAGENVPREYEFRIMRKDKTRATVNMNVGLITYHGRVASMGTVKDITERKRALKALRESEARYRRLVEFSPYGIVIHSDHKLVYTNEAAAEIFGARTPQELLGKPMLQFIHPDYHEIVKKRIRMQEKKIIAPLMEEKFLRLDGTSVDVEVVSIPFIYNGKLAMYGVFQDITERKRAEKTLKEREERFRSVVDSAVNAIVLADNTGAIISWNKGAEQIFLYSKKEVLGKPLTILIPELYRDAHLASLKRVSSTGESKVIGKFIELHGVRKDGTEFPLELSLATWKTAKGTFYSGIIQDITERKQADDQIKASLKEKEILLREIHHRVKNNIQVISSLLSLQSEYIKEEKYRDMFKESQNRILSMALIHEKLYQSRDLAKIDFNDYVRDLVYDLFEYYGANTGNIALNINVENVSLGIDSAIPCGLIINELVTNSLKYAFQDGRKGELKVSLRSIDDNTVELIIGDNGIGIPKDLDFRNTQSLGLHLVTILVENQLHGEINLDRSNGTEFRIKFKGGK